MFRSSRNPLMWPVLWRRHHARLQGLAAEQPFLYERGYPGRRRNRRVLAAVGSLALGFYEFLASGGFRYLDAGSTPGSRPLLPWMAGGLGVALPWLACWYLNRADRRRRAAGFSSKYPPPRNED